MTTATGSLFEKHKDLLNQAMEALKDRKYYTPYPESPRAYAEDADARGKSRFLAMMNEDFKELLQSGETGFIGEEVSPYLQVGLGIRYPKFRVEDLVKKAEEASESWRKTDPGFRAGILIETLEKIKDRFFDIAYATMHSTGQSYIMSFQASGPHANDRALEAIAAGYSELTRYVHKAEWVKNMGKFDVKLQKTFKPMPKGVGLVIGCSTFPTWNTVPGLYADLITGNTVIVKPHPKAVLPIAIVVAEIQKVFKANGVNPDVVQLAVDSTEQLITKELAEHPSVKLIDYTGSSHFGNYIESLGKTCFTEKAGINPVILDSAADLKAVTQNIAFSVSLYSGQMCTAPQNIFIPESGVRNGDAHVSYEEAVQMLSQSLNELVDNPKMAAGTLGGIQAEATMSRLKNAPSMGGKVLVGSRPVANPEFEHARTVSPVLIELDASDRKIYDNECFGPVAFVIKTRSTAHSVELARELSEKHGAITCLAYTTDEKTRDMIEETMNRVFTPVSFNFTGALFVNSHAAFSDFHVTGGNPAGNASFTNADFINRRFVWVGNRYA